MKRMIAILALVALAAGTLVAGGSGESDSDVPQLRFATTWGAADSKGVYFIPMLEKFQEEHAGELELVVEEYGSDDLVTKTTVELASGELPDIFTYWGGVARLGPLAEGNALLDMDEYFDRTSTGLTPDDFSQSGINHYTIDGKLIGLPTEANLGAFIINKEMFDEFGLDVPETYEDMIAAGQVLRENGIIPFAMGSNGGNPSHLWFSEMYKQFDGGLEEIEAIPETNLFATDNALRVAELIDDMRQNGMYPADTVSNGNWGPSFALYNEGRAAMIFTWPWMLGAMDQEMQDKSLVIDVPQLPGSSVDTSTMISGMSWYGFVVNRESFEDPAKQEILIKLIDYMISDEMFTDLMKGGLIPTKNADLPLDAFNDILQQTLSHYSDHEWTTTHNWLIHDEAVMNYFKGALDELYAGIIDPQQFVDQVQSAFDDSTL